MQNLDDLPFRDLPPLEKFGVIAAIVLMIAFFGAAINAWMVAP